MRETINQEFEIQSVLSEAIRIDDGQSALSYKRAIGAIEALDRAGFSIMPKIADGRIDALYEASRTGVWSDVSEREWKAWGAAIHAGYISKKVAVAPVQPDVEILVSLERPSDLTNSEHAVLDAELVIARAIKMYADFYVHQSAEERAHEITYYLAKAGLEIRYKPLDLVPETAKQAAAGDYSTMTDRKFADLKVQLERMGLVHGAIVRADGSITPLDKDALDAGVAAVGERPRGYEWAQRPKKTFELMPGLVADLPAGTEISSDRGAFWAQLLISKILEDGGSRQVEDGIDEAGQEALVRLDRDRTEKRRPPLDVATRDLVLFDNDADFADETVEALRLDSHPGEGKVTLGWLIDEHADLRQTLSELICDITGGAVSKPNTDMDFVHTCAGQAFVMNLLEEHPKLAEDPLFRPVMEQHFDASEISGAVEIARLRLDGNRVVRIGRFGTFNFGKDAA